MELSYRQQQIMNAARAAGRVEVEAMAAELSVTPQTIRRDLNELCARRLLARVHGGAVLASALANLAYDARRMMAAEAKEQIGRICAEAIPDGASLFINIGTTTEAVARALGNRRDMLVITNNLNIANIMAANPQCDVVVAGGMLRRSDGGLVGESTIDMVRQFKADYAVIGASAVDDDGTLLDFDYREVRVSQAIIANARKTFLVADSSKFARSAPVRIADMGSIDAFFTDRVTSPALREVCQDNGVVLYETAAGEDTP
ncbi:MAG: DeoR/GlpR family DNA-binding transcription regulator [Paracoccaceae bacterium]|nr:DeoR/GlpR family DNA-binding transcription regulator [Paracoccaceae bacterium]